MQVDLTTGDVAGTEALVRRKHPTPGLLSPADLLPAAEQAGLMRPLVDTVLELALTAATRWWPARAVPDPERGRSVLAYLRHLPADELKLNRSLTADVDRDARAAAIVEHAVALADDLGLRLVAEGVEDASTGEVLARLGCDVAQGFAVARPMPVEEFLDWLATPRPFLLGDGQRTA